MMHNSTRRCLPRRIKNTHSSKIEVMLTILTPSLFMPVEGHSKHTERYIEFNKIFIRRIRQNLHIINCYMSTPRLQTQIKYVARKYLTFLNLHFRPLCYQNVVCLCVCVCVCVNIYLEKY